MLAWIIQSNTFFNFERLFEIEINLSLDIFLTLLCNEMKDKNMVNV